MKNQSEILKFTFEYNYKILYRHTPAAVCAWFSEITNCNLFSSAYITIYEINLMYAILL